MKQFLMAAGLLCAPAVGQGQVVSVQTSPAVFIYSQVTQWNGQSFTATATDILGAGVQIVSASGNVVGELTMQLYDARPDLGGTLLASGTKEFALTAGVTNWIDVFWSGVNTTIGGTYWLATKSMLTTNQQVYTWGSINQYAEGISTVTYQPSAVDATPDLVWSGYDHAMRVWSTPPTPTDPPPPMDVPEPASVTLVLTGACALMARRLRA